MTGSTLLDGVFWSIDLQPTTYERSREFHLCAADGSLHTVAEALSREFKYLPRHAPEANAIALAVPDVDVALFRTAFAAD